MSQMKVVIDIGGTGARFGLVKSQQVTSVGKASIRSVSELANAVMRFTKNITPSAVAVAVPGTLIGDKVQLSRNAGWLVGDTPALIGNALGVSKDRVRIVHDGEAHVLALCRNQNVNFGAINFALGTSVAFGALDAGGRVLRSLSGDCWEIGDFMLNTSAKNKFLWHALGTAGLDELSRWTDDDGLSKYGSRLGNFVVQMSKIFRPRTVGLSGGIIKHNWGRIQEGFYEEFNRIKEFKKVTPTPQVIVRDDIADTAALIGLSTLIG